ncbi:hypothetical protein Pla123a_38470 [Posidoniimonas polymericola]|uniref:UPF0102 protein Pla123a_38470 n=1 Tax=Posidoniimonas polymericola TaxID=2528002 RepID=A0A5C5YG72_9BACT|nr:YraN family protein [Posidoniimonas polymericola]TWT73511.1 hypothetical protein Pla123a_38470 [Posidoniimonas polymericola]
MSSLLRRVQRGLARVGAGPRAATLGQRGEAYAARLLRRAGCVMVAGGHRGRFGEIDLIVVESRETVVFVEVKTRRSLRGGSPAEAVGAEQQRRISRSALAFLKAHGLLEHPARFDVVAIVWPKGSTRPESVQHFRNAFHPPDRGQFFS